MKFRPETRRRRWRGCRLGERSATFRRRRGRLGMTTGRRRCRAGIGWQRRVGDEKPGGDEAAAAAIRNPSCCIFDWLNAPPTTPHWEWLRHTCRPIGWIAADPSGPVVARPQPSRHQRRRQKKRSLLPGPAKGSQAVRPCWAAKAGNKWSSCQQKRRWCSTADSCGDANRRVEQSVNSPYSALLSKGGIRIAANQAADAAGLTA